MSVSIDWSRMGPGYFFKNFPWDSSMWFWGRTTAIGNRESIQLCKQDGDVKTLKKKKKSSLGNSVRDYRHRARGGVSVHMLLDPGYRLERSPSQQSSTLCGSLTCVKVNDKC